MQATPIKPLPFFSILRLHSNFPRPVGDSSNPLTHSFDVRVSIVKGASVQSIVFEGGKALVPQYIEAGLAQISLGAIAVGTSCGFMAQHQDEISRALPVPFISSSLLQLAALRNQFGKHANIGVITFSEEFLSSTQWFQSLATDCVTVSGLSTSSHLYRVIKDDLPELDCEQARLSVQAAASNLMERSPNLKAVVLECTNLGPYRSTVETICDCPVFDYNDLMAECWQSALAQ